MNPVLFVKQFLRPPSPQVFPPHTLRRKRLYILPTPHGLLFIIVLAGMLLGSVNYNNNLGFLLTFLLGSMTFVSTLHTHRNLCGVQIISVVSQPVFAGEEAVFEFLVHADASIRSAIGFQLPGGELAYHDLLPRQETPVSVTVPATKRGMLRPGPLLIVTRYPLGLFRAWSEPDLSLECPVYPPPVYGPFESAEGDSPSQDDAGQKRVAGVDDFDGLKTYQPGDALQHISWKAFSRGQGLLTKSFVGQTGASVILDWEAIRETDTERKLSRLCGMVLKASRLNLTYGLKLPGNVIDLGKGEAHKHNCLRALALFGLPTDT